MIRRSLRNLLLHVDGSEHALERPKFAQAIAQPCSARITALYAVTPWLMLYPGPLEGMSPAYTVLSEEDAEKRNRAKAAFQAAATGMANVDWLEGELTSPYEFGNNALYSDLMVLGQKIRSNRDVPDDFIPSVIMDSGKPAIIVPTDVAHMQAPLNSVLIAWNASRESCQGIVRCLAFAHRGLRGARGHLWRPHRRPDRQHQAGALPSAS